MKLYDIALIEKPGCEGLSKANMVDLYDSLNGTEAYPIEIGHVNGESSAMGLITPTAAEKLDYEYDQSSALASYLSLVLDDMDRESDDCEYEYQGLSIWLSRESA